MFSCCYFHFLFLVTAGHYDQHKNSDRRSLIYGTRVQVYIKTNPEWLELPLARTNFHSPKRVQATEVLLYTAIAGSKQTALMQTVLRFTAGFCPYPTT